MVESGPALFFLSLFPKKNGTEKTMGNLTIGGLQSMELSWRGLFRISLP